MNSIHTIFFILQNHYQYKYYVTWNISNIDNFLVQSITINNDYGILIQKLYVQNLRLT
jgi:hypothetical protein